MLLCLAVLAAAAPTAPAVAGTTRTSAERSALAIGVLTEVNHIRVGHRLAPLALNSRLSAAALQHSTEMVRYGYFRHDSLDGTSFATRMKRYYGSAAAGENLLWSVPDIRAAEALRLWMASPAHRAEILAPRWREIGIGSVHAAAAPGVYRGRPVTVITADFGDGR